MMSSPYSLKTNKGTEETLEAIERTREWASRIDIANDVSDVDVGTFLLDLREEEERLREEYRVKTTEVAIDNFVANKEEAVKDVLCGNLDEKTSALAEVSEYINEDFGREEPYSLSKEELMWLVAQEVMSQSENRYGPEMFSEPPISNVDLDSVGEKPSIWEEGYPRYK